MNSSTRIFLALILGLLAGLVSGLANGLDLATAVQRAVVFSMLTAAIVGVLSWSMDLASRKGYSPWLGFWLVLLFNVIGLLLLALLPSRASESNKA
jgi:ABC-type transport system involved in cytochrome c biogenesis permease subunit